MSDSVEPACVSENIIDNTNIDQVEHMDNNDNLCEYGDMCIKLEKGTCDKKHLADCPYCPYYPKEMEHLMNECFNGLECRNKYCTFKHENQQPRRRPAVLSIIERCTLPKCCSYLCRYSHDGQDIINRPLKAKNAYHCKFGDKCVVPTCIYLHNGQEAPERRVNAPSDDGGKFIRVSSTTNPSSRQVSVAKSAPSKPSRNASNTSSTVSKSSRNDSNVNSTNSVNSAKRPQKQTRFADIVASQKVTNTVDKPWGEYEEPPAVQERPVEPPVETNWTFPIKFSVHQSEFVVSEKDANVRYDSLGEKFPFLNKEYLGILKAVWFDGNQIMADRVNCLSTILKNYIDMHINIITTAYKVLYKKNLEDLKDFTLEETTLALLDLNTADAQKYFIGFPSIVHLWNNGDITFNNRLRIITNFYVGNIANSIRVLTLIRDMTNKQPTYSDIASSTATVVVAQPEESS